MTSHGPGHDHRTMGHHDWQSEAYVREWIDGDVTKDGARKPLIQRMLELAPFSDGDSIKVLDVGGGYGIVAGEVLSRFPNATLTLQDYSQPMLGQAQTRLAAFGDRVRFEQRDFTVDGWADGLGGPFDLAVSGIAIHNLGGSGPIASVYRAVCEALKPSGAFLNLDYPQYAGGLETHLGWLRDAGFERVEQAWEENSQSALAAFK